MKDINTNIKVLLFLSMLFSLENIMSQKINFTPKNIEAGYTKGQELAEQLKPSLWKIWERKNPTEIIDTFFQQNSSLTEMEKLFVLCEVQQNLPHTDYNLIETYKQNNKIKYSEEECTHYKECIRAKKLIVSPKPTWSWNHIHTNVENILKKHPKLKEYIQYCLAIKNEQTTQALENINKKKEQLPYNIPLTYPVLISGILSLLISPVSGPLAPFIAVPSFTVLAGSFAVGVYKSEIDYEVAKYEREKKLHNAFSKEVI